MNTTSFTSFFSLRFIGLMISLLMTMSCNAEDTHDHSQHAEPAPAPVGINYEEDVHYTVLTTPVRTTDPSKIEVVEAFWYGCGHCYNFEPILQPWVKRLSDDVNFVHLPATWNNNMIVHAGMFYTAQMLGLLDVIHPAIFTEMHVKKKKFIREEEVQEFFEGFGIDEATFKKTYHSFSVNSLIKQAQAKVRGYQVSGTPSMIVNGKYLVESQKAGGQAGMLKVSKFLIAKERQAMAAPNSEM